MKEAFKSTLKRIADNRDGKYLDHHQITVLAYGLLAILHDPSFGIDYADDVELLLTMLTKRMPHHARCVLAAQCVEFLDKGGEPKKLEGQIDPEDF